MKRMLPLSTCLAAACLLLAACVKEPGGPGIPLPNKPVWLLTKTIHRINHGKPEWGWMNRYKIVHEYRYNQHNKPWLHIYYNNVADSNNLLPTDIDTVYYDQWKRVKQVSHYSVGQGRTHRQQRFVYNGKDKLPAAEDIYSIYDNEGNVQPQPVYIYRNSYVYRDTLVYMIRDQGVIDSIRLAYDAIGNHLRSDIYYWHLHAYVWDDLFTAFNPAPNPELFFNLDHGLVFRIDDARSNIGVLSPLISKHTWTTYTSAGSSPGPYVVRSIIRNEHGLVAYTISPYRDYSNNPPFDETIEYIYTKVKK